MAEWVDRAVAEHERRGTTMACPVCWNHGPLFNHCYHDGQDIPSRTVPLAEAQEKRAKIEAEFREDRWDAFTEEEQALIARALRELPRGLPEIESQIQLRAELLRQIDA